MGSSALPGGCQTHRGMGLSACLWGGRILEVEQSWVAVGQTQPRVQHRTHNGDTGQDRGTCWEPVLSPALPPALRDVL